MACEPRHFLARYPAGKIVCQVPFNLCFERSAADHAFFHAMYIAIERRTTAADTPK